MYCDLATTRGGGAMRPVEKLGSPRVTRGGKKPLIIGNAPRNVIQFYKSASRKGYTSISIFTIVPL